MEKLSEIAYTFEQGTEKWSPEFEIILNQAKTGYLFDCAALVASAKKDGIFPVVVCNCGHIACSGMYVKVEHRENFVYWTDFYHGQVDTESFPESDKIKFFRFSDNNAVESPLKFTVENYNQITDEIERIIMSNETDSKKYFIGEVKRYREGKDMFRA